MAAFDLKSITISSVLLKTAITSNNKQWIFIIRGIFEMENKPFF